MSRLARWLPADRDRREWLVLGAAVLVVSVVLLVLSYTPRAGPGWNYLIGVLGIIAIYAIFALGLSLEFGHAGLLNFGHVAFMAIAGYTVGILASSVPLGPGGEPILDLAAPALEGLTLWGFLASLLVALVAGLVVLVPAMLLSPRIRALRTPRARLAAPAALAGLVALLVLLTTFPLGEDGARNAFTLVAILAGIALAAFAGFLLGLPAVRLREDYLAIVTIGAAEILRSVALNEEWLTRGSLGIIGLHNPINEWIADNDWWSDLSEALDVRPVGLARLVLALLVLAYVYVVLAALARSPWGRVMKAIREDEDVAAALGKNVTWYKLQALMIGSGVAAVAGVLFVWTLSSVYPQHFLPAVTFFAFIILVVGGVGNHRGAILGAILVWGIFEFFGQLTFLQRYGIDFVGPVQHAFVGLALILVMMFRPHGVLGRKEELVLGK